jgi:hypothetical protein
LNSSLVDSVAIDCGNVGFGISVIMFLFLGLGSAALPLAA